MYRNYEKMFKKLRNSNKKVIACNNTNVTELNDHPQADGNEIQVVFERKNKTFMKVEKKKIAKNIFGSHFNNNLLEGYDEKLGLKYVQNIFSTTGKKKKKKRNVLETIKNNKTTKKIIIRAETGQIIRVTFRNIDSLVTRRASHSIVPKRYARHYETVKKNKNKKNNKKHEKIKLNNRNSKNVYSRAFNDFSTYGYEYANGIDGSQGHDDEDFPVINDDDNSHDDAVDNEDINNDDSGNEDGNDGDNYDDLEEEDDGGGEDDDDGGGEDDDGANGNDDAEYSGGDDEVKKVNPCSNKASNLENKLLKLKTKNSLHNNYTKKRFKIQNLKRYFAKNKKLFSKKLKSFWLKREEDDYRKPLKQRFKLVKQAKRSVELLDRNYLCKFFKLNLSTKKKENHFSTFNNFAVSICKRTTNEIILNFLIKLICKVLFENLFGFSQKSCVYLFFRPSIYPFPRNPLIHYSKHAFFNSSFLSLIHPHFHPPIHPSFNTTIKIPGHSSSYFRISLPIHPTTHRASTSSIHPAIHPPTYSSFAPSIHLPPNSSSLNNQLLFFHSPIHKTTIKATFVTKMLYMTNAISDATEREISIENGTTFANETNFSEFVFRNSSHGNEHGKTSKVDKQVFNHGSINTTSNEHRLVDKAIEFNPSKINLKTLRSDTMHTLSIATSIPSEPSSRHQALYNKAPRRKKSLRNMNWNKKSLTLPTPPSPPNGIFSVFYDNHTPSAVNAFLTTNTTINTAKIISNISSFRPKNSIKNIIYLKSFKRKNFFKNLFLEQNKIQKFVQKISANYLEFVISKLKKLNFLKNAREIIQKQLQQQKQLLIQHLKNYFLTKISKQNKNYSHDTGQKTLQKKPKNRSKSAQINQSTDAVQLEVGSFQKTRLETACIDNSNCHSHKSQFKKDFPRKKEIFKTVKKHEKENLLLKNLLLKRRIMKEFLQRKLKELQKNKIKNQKKIQKNIKEKSEKKKRNENYVLKAKNSQKKPHGNVIRQATYRQPHITFYVDIPLIKVFSLFCCHFSHF